MLVAVVQWTRISLADNYAVHKAPHGALTLECCDRDLESSGWISHHGQLLALDVLLPLIETVPRLRRQEIVPCFGKLSVLDLRCVDNAFPYLPDTSIYKKLYFELGQPNGTCSHALNKM